MYLVLGSEWATSLTYYEYESDEQCQLDCENLLHLNNFHEVSPKVVAYTTSKLVDKVTVSPVGDRHLAIWLNLGMDKDGDWIIYDYNIYLVNDDYKMLKFSTRHADHIDVYTRLKIKDILMLLLHIRELYTTLTLLAELNLGEHNSADYLLEELRPLED